jgi:hypothetical protein
MTRDIIGIIFSFLILSPHFQWQVLRKFELTVRHVAPIEGGELPALNVKYRNVRKGSMRLGSILGPHAALNIEIA